MPLRCLDPNGRSIQSFDLSVDEWELLLRENRKARHLRMPCCQAQVILKRSRLGTPFFAHRAVGACDRAPETEEHLRLKQMAVEAARACGWTAETEVSGSTPSGELWKADVLAQNGRHRVAVEIQWSGQTEDETLRRQERYSASGVRGLWLLRQPGFPVTKEVPAVCIGGSLKEGFLALIPRYRGMTVRDRQELKCWKQVLPMAQLFRAAFTQRLRFGLAPREDATARLRTGVLDCWKCGCETRIVTFFEVVSGPNEFQLTVSDLDGYPDLAEVIRANLHSSLEVGALKRRFSKTQQRLYLSNGCAHCDALMGQLFEHQAWHSQESVWEFPLRLSDRWREAIRARDYGKSWSVY